MKYFDDRRTRGIRRRKKRRRRRRRRRKHRYKRNGEIRGREVCL